MGDRAAAGSPIVEAEATEPKPPPLSTLFHRLNNQLGSGLANAELIEVKATDEHQRARAAQVVESVLAAMVTARELRDRVAPGRPPD